MIRDSTCHGVQQNTNAPSITVIVRRALRARFSLLLCAGAPAAPDTLLARNIGPPPERPCPCDDEFFFDFLLPCRDDLLLVSVSVLPAYLFPGNPGKSVYLRQDIRVQSR